MPLATWFRGPLGESFSREMNGNIGLIDCELFNGAVIRRLTQQHRAGFRDHSRVLWLLWVFQRFLTDVHDRSATGQHALESAL